jgi:hypothetical protein
VAARQRSTEDIAARMVPALARVMGPGDKVVASTVAVRATFFYGYLVILLALLLGFFATAMLAGHLAAAVPFLAAGGLLNLTWLTGRLSLFLAVTEQQVICYGLTYGAPLSLRPGRLLLSAPRAAVIATAGPQGRRLRIMAGGVSLQLLLGTRGSLQREAAEVVTALQAGTAGHQAG